jgi:hypothetical protein
VEEENSLLDGHEITIIDRDNIIDNESYVGPRTRWSKPNRSKKMFDELSCICFKSLPQCDSTDFCLSAILVFNEHMISDESESCSSSLLDIEREERISRQKEKQEEFKRNMINKQQNEKLDEKNSIVGNKSTSPSNVNDTARFSETSQFTDDTDLLLYTRHTDSKPVVIVDSREINGAQVSIIRHGRS